MEVWVLTGHTESGDPIGPYVFNRRPNDQEAYDTVAEDFPLEVEAEENHGCTYLWYDIQKTKVIKL